MTETKDAKAQLDEVTAANPNCDPLMDRCPDGATDAELAASIAIWRAERATWRAKE